MHVIHFKRNQGKAEALMAGFAAATADIVITMDADLQDDPSEIPKLIETLNNENYDVVSGWKYPRKDPIEKRAFSFVFNRVTAFSTGVKLHDMNCGFKAYRAEVVKELYLYGDLHRYIPILAHQAGYKVGEVKVRHHPRRFGVSKYGFKRIPKRFFDLFTVLFLTKYLKRPLHVFGTIGAAVASIGILIGFYLAVLWVMKGGVGFRPLLMLSVLMIILGIQFFSIGLLGELVIGLIFPTRTANNITESIRKHNYQKQRNTPHMIHSRLLQWARILPALAILFFLVKRLHNLLTAVEMESITFKPFWLFASLTLLLAYLGTLGIPWFFLYRVGSGKLKKTSEATNLTNKVQNPLLSGWAFFQLSQLGRYLPGKVGQFVVMFSLSNKFGIQKKGAVLATCFQLAFQCAVGCFIGFLVLRNTDVAPILHDVLTKLQISGKTALFIGSITILTLGASIIFFYRRRIRETFADLMQQDFRAMFSLLE